MLSGFELYPRWVPLIHCRKANPGSTMFRFCAFYPQLWTEGKGRGLLNIFRRTIVLKSAYLSALTNVKNISYTTRIK